MVSGLSDEEVAARIVGIYFEEIARLGFKRSLGLDEVINAYYYTLSRLKNKGEAMKIATEKVVREEKILLTETKNEIVPPVTETTTTTTTTVSEQAKP